MTIAFNDRPWQDNPERPDGPECYSDEYEDDDEDDDDHLYDAMWYELDLGSDEERDTPLPVVSDDEPPY
jgi:hypothetical protein